jgi:hypothetical protein
MSTTEITCRKPVITEQTVMLVHTTPGEPRTTFRANISIDYIDPGDPTHKVQHYESRSSEVKLRVPGTYSHFAAECRSMTKVVYGLTRHSAVSVQRFSIEVLEKGAKQSALRTHIVTERNWSVIERYLDGRYMCVFELRAQTSKEPWSIDYDSDSDDSSSPEPYVMMDSPSLSSSSSRLSFRESHGFQQPAQTRHRLANGTGDVASKPDVKKRQKFGRAVSSSSAGVLRVNASFLTDSDPCSDRADDNKVEGRSWTQRLFELCGGRR